MATTFTSKPLQSGNHGRNNLEPNTPSDVNSLVPSTTPQQSTRGFVAPAVAPVKKTPDITDITDEGARERRSEGDNEPQTADFTPPTHPLTHSPTHPLAPSLSSTTEFPTHWQTMFNRFFASIPIYFSLKESIPTIENNIITFVVQNSFQKEHFEAKSREVLEYLRSHFDEKIENIVIETNEQLQTKKIIYDGKDKYKNFKEQNEEFEDSIQILELTIKD